MKKIICLMGPTASGKTPLAVEMVQRFPCEIVSVDSAMVYRGMDIGTAKPDRDTLALAPHHLIDMVDPKDSYSAGRFRDDALRVINDIIARQRVPLLVGGTMLYFRILQQGLANLPTADAATRQRLDEQAEKEGWQALHAWLASVDPVAAKRIHVNDVKRIQRALEVYLLTGKTISEWQQENAMPLAPFTTFNIILSTPNRALLHERIAQRFQLMLNKGLIEEVKLLYDRGDLTADLPAIQSVGYRQVWDYLAGQYDYHLMQEKAIAATRQLAKRQLTWLRSWPDAVLIDAEDSNVFSKTAAYLHSILFS